jgi:hypothetical protein
MELRIILDATAIILLGYKAFNSMVEFRGRFWIFQSILYAFFAHVLYISSQYSPSNAADMYFVEISSICCFLTTILGMTFIRIL